MIQINVLGNIMFGQYGVNETTCTYKTSVHIRLVKDPVTGKSPVHEAFLPRGKALELELWGVKDTD